MKINIILLLLVRCIFNSTKMFFLNCNISLFQDLYFKYVWNNFLHSHVTQCIYTILCNAPLEVEGSKQQPLLNQVCSSWLNILLSFFIMEEIK